MVGTYKKERAKWVDVARGFAMLCVILGHMNVGQVLKTLIFSFHMPLFFLLGGYFMKDRTLPVFLRNKSRSLLVPYLFTGICLILAVQVKNGAKILLHRQDALSPQYLLTEWIKAVLLGSGARKDFLWIQSDIAIGAVWFLLALFVSQLIVNQLAHRKYWLLSVALIALVGIVSAKYVWLPLSVQAGAAASVFVATGYVYRERGGGY